MSNSLPSFFRRHLASLFPAGPAKPALVESPPKSQSENAILPLQHFLSIPTPERSIEETERTHYHSRAQYLARQERWDVLAEEIRDADQNRKATPGGMPVADLLAYGAREDVVLAVEHALFDGTPSPGAPLLDGIEALEYVLSEHRTDYAIALIVAHAHIDIGWAWRGTGWKTELDTRNREAFEAHFDRAEAILSEHCGVMKDAPALAAARCALLAGTSAPHLRVADDYQDLIDLNHANPRPMRALGNHMLPRWFGSYQGLELEARRTASRTQHHWGAGGYTWVYFDAMVVDEIACAQVDLPFFIEGLHDILNVDKTQHTANMLAAHCTVALRDCVSSIDAADLIRTQLKECSAWIIRDHLTELHPLVWAHAAQGFDNAARVSSFLRFAAKGKADAMGVIAEQFREEIIGGNRVTFTPDGPAFSPL